MIENAPLTQADLTPFADLGTEVSMSRRDGSPDAFMFERNGVNLAIAVKNDQRISVSEQSGRVHRFNSVAAMLAGPLFADLQQWSEHQEYIFQGRTEFSDPIPVFGGLRTEANEANAVTETDLDVHALENSLVQTRLTLETGKSLILVVNGPAGSGKTTLIEELARRRAADWRNSFGPLVLHVESRGRVLQNLRDLLAFSLQTLRVSVTYDQVVPLVKHGLVILAIDGFDELADPNGYETAWSQLNELIDDTRGRATLIMAGRETFISLPRVQSALPAFQRTRDQMPLLTLREVEPNVAKTWLRNRGWTDTTFSLSAVEPIFERGSYALRPVFLSQFHGLKEELEKETEIVADLLSYFVERMLDRESTKFTELQDQARVVELRNYLQSFLQEIARDLAENQTNAIPNESLRWLAEFSASEKFDQEFSGVLANRAQNVSFLTPDARTDHTRFAHEQISIHFLAQDCYQAVENGEVPKYVRRNIFGEEALEGFARVARTLNRDRAHSFVVACESHLARLRNIDRSRQNLAAFAVIVASIAEALQGKELVVEGLDLNELMIPADAPSIVFSNVTINTLYARSVDLTSVTWNGASVITLFADDLTVIGDDMPLPTVVELPNNTLRNRNDIEEWLYGSEVVFEGEASVVPEQELELLKRLDRYRPFWLREDPSTDDRTARRIVNDPNWSKVKRKLLDLSLIRERTVAASGPRANFIHIYRSGGMLSENRQVLSALAEK